MRIYLVRHARQCSPLCNVNVELAQEGVQQAELLAARMKMWIPVDAIYSSALLRARQTAGILGQWRMMRMINESEVWIYGETE